MPTHLPNMHLQPVFQNDKLQHGVSQLLLVASDGELYGHHQYLRDRFLARLVDGASHSMGMRPTFPALWLKNSPPSRRVGIHE